MRSIDNLREWANGLHGVYINQVDHTITVTTGWDAPPDMDSVSLRDHVNGILDGIEREVEELRDRDYRNGREDAEGAVEFADRLKASVDKREDVTLWGVDYTALPVDADGVPIHVGDVMEFTYDPPQDQPLFEVSGFGAGGTLFYAARGEVIPRKVTKASVVRHHHAPTVEDVLREFAEKMNENMGMYTGEVIDADEWRDADRQTIAEYAAKLRLAESE